MMAITDMRARKQGLLTRRQFLKVSATAGIGGMILAACGTSGGTSAPAGGGGAASMDQLVTAAKGEGTLSTIALPHDWLNYGEMIETFKTKYGLQVNELDPNAGSGVE